MAAVPVGPVPLEGWPADGVVCSGNEVPLEAIGSVMITAPTAPGPYAYPVTFNGTLAPAGSNDGSAINGTTPATFMLTVAAIVANTPPVLTLPANMTVEGNATGGWTAAWTVTATDAEDEPDPAATCVPAVGALLPLGTTTVNCSVTDSGTLTTNGSFTVTVVDTTAPTLAGVPANLAVVTADPLGAAASWTDPTATDIVDATPTVGCLPVSGSIFLPGATTVTCTATDDSSNVATASFVVTVGPDVTNGGVPSAVFGPPIQADGLGGHAGRTIPMKVRLMLDGASIGEGSLVLAITPCAGGDPVAELAMSWQAGSERWMGLWRTRGLEPGCYSIRAMLDGVDVGGTEVRLFGKGGPSAATAPEAAGTAPEAAPEAEATPTTKAHGTGTTNPNARGGKTKP
jgi:hypothetical protein